MPPPMNAHLPAAPPAPATSPATPPAPAAVFPLASTAPPACLVQLCRHPVSALRFVLPLVRALEGAGVRAPLWIEPAPGLSVFVGALRCETRILRFALGARLWRAPFVLAALVRALRAERPRAIEVHSTLAAPLPLLAARLAGVPVRIYHNHGLPFLGYRGPLRWALKAVERVNLQLCTHSLTVSTAMRAALRDAGVGGARPAQDADAPLRSGRAGAGLPEVIAPGSACGIDFEEFSLCTSTAQKPLHKERQGIARDAFVVLYVGRAHRRKGFPLTLEVWRRHFAQRPRCVLVLAGCSEAEARAALGAELPANVRALGFIEELRDWYAAADTVLLPSHHEGLPYALLEGAASACSLVASDLPGLDQIVVDGVTGFRVPVGDEDALAEVLTRLAGEEETRSRLGDAARAHVAAYDRERFLQAYLDWVLPLLAEPGPAAPLAPA